MNPSDTSGGEFDATRGVVLIQGNLWGGTTHDGGDLGAYR